MKFDENYLSFFRKEEEALGSEKGIYETLPPQIKEVSKQIETVTQQLAHLFKEKQPKIGEVMFMSSAVSRSGGPVSLIPQPSRFHEFDVLSHLDMSAYVALKYDVFVLPFINPAIHHSLTRLVEVPPNLELILASQIHDLEKIIVVREMGSKPWEKSSKPKYNMLSGNLCSNEEEKGIKQQATKYILGAEASFDDTPLRNLRDSLRESGIDLAECRNYLKVYDWIDQLFINGRYQQESVEELVNEFREFVNSEKLNVKQAVAGIIIMMCDNIAQGNPPHADDFYWRQRNTHLELCSVLIKGILEQYE